VSFHPASPECPLPAPIQRLLPENSSHRRSPAKACSSNQICPEAGSKRMNIAEMDGPKILFTETANTPCFEHGFKLGIGNRYCLSNFVTARFTAF
jgi:hypothetical protein